MPTFSFSKLSVVLILATWVTLFAPHSPASTCGRAAEPIPGALLALKSFVDSFKSHGVEIKDGMGYIKIGRIVRGELTFFKLVIRAIREGTIAEIQTGMVVGPKVLPMLSKLRSIAPPAGQKVVISGTLSPTGIIKSAEKELEAQEMGKPYAIGPHRWTRSEIIDFENAVRDLGLRDLDARFAHEPNYRGYLEFKITSGAKEIEWIFREW